MNFYEFNLNQPIVERKTKTVYKDGKKIKIICRELFKICNFK